MRLGVCSWSLRPSGPEDLVAKLAACGITRVQLALGPLRAKAWAEAATRRALDQAGVVIASGMLATLGEDYSTLESIRETGGVRSDRHWKQNLANARVEAELAQRLDLGLVSFHAGFLPHERGALRATMLERLRAFVQVFGERGVRLAFETGQERADVLLEVLAELDEPSCGVNFDPANMLLYGMGDPLEALARLGSRVLQVHWKDAIAATRPGEWGVETRLGQGQVDWPRFVATLRSVAPRAEGMIEREAGEERVRDIRAACELLRPLLGGAA